MSGKLMIIAVLAILCSSVQGGIAPAAIGHAAPAVAFASPALAYTNAIPYNIPPYSDRVDLFNKALAVPVAAYAAAPVLHASPVAAGVIPQPVALAAPHALPTALATPHAVHAAPAVATPLASGVVPPNVLPAYSAGLGHALPAHAAYAAPIFRL